MSALPARPPQLFRNFFSRPPLARQLFSQLFCNCCQSTFSELFRNFFPRARAEGSCLVRLPLGVWIELAPMPDRAGPIEKSKENRWFFLRARAKGSCCLGLPLGVWIELAPMPERAGPIEKSKENLGFFNIFSLKCSKTHGFSTF